MQNWGSGDRERTGRREARRSYGEGRMSWYRNDRHPLWMEIVGELLLVVIYCCSLWLVGKITESNPAPWGYFLVTLIAVNHWNT